MDKNIWYISIIEYRAVIKREKTQATQNNEDKPLNVISQVKETTQHLL